jgi:hypothetical protein|tara:strand:+ start:449 stop:712 length:264 start_codon:yes stop_codon:yes gene_type:complete
MPIRGPKNATPTPIGWVSPKGELLKSQRITSQQIAEFHGDVPSTATQLNEAPVHQTSLGAMTDVELEVTSLHYDIDLSSGITEELED